MFFPVEEGPVYVLQISLLRLCGQISFSEGFSLPLSARFVLNEFLF